MHKTEHRSPPCTCHTLLKSVRLTVTTPFTSPSVFGFAGLHLEKRFACLAWNGCVWQTKREVLTPNRLLCASWIAWWVMLFA